MIPNMTGFEIKEVPGHRAALGHTWALGNAQDHRDTHGDLVHGICIRIWTQTPWPMSPTFSWTSCPVPRLPVWPGNSKFAYNLKIVLFYGIIGIFFINEQLSWLNNYQAFTGKILDYIITKWKVSYECDEKLDCPFVSNSERVKFHHIYITFH